MPLDRVVPAMSGIESRFRQQLPRFTTVAGHPLHSLIQPHLLTPRLITEKYYKRIALLIDAEDVDEINPDDALMWLVLRNEKAAVEGGVTPEEDQAAAEECWRGTWLARMEQREYGFIHTV